MKSTVDEIRERFDNDVERFSNLETGQSATIDSPLCLDLIAQAAVATTPNPKSILDIGCGAGNYSLKLLEKFGQADVTLIDLSRPMLDRASERVGEATAGRVQNIQADIREAALGAAQYDVVVAASVLHHLRTDDEWADVCTKIYNALTPGGSFWIFDLVSHASPAVQSVMNERYGDYLIGLRDQAYRDEVFAYIEREDSPISALAIVDHLNRAGFAGIEVLHKHSCFAALGGAKPV